MLAVVAAGLRRRARRAYPNDSAPAAAADRVDARVKVVAVVSFSTDALGEFAGVLDARLRRLANEQTDIGTVEPQVAEQVERGLDRRQQDDRPVVAFVEPQQQEDDNRRFACAGQADQVAHAAEQDCVAVSRSTPRLRSGASNRNLRVPVSSRNRASQLPRCRSGCASSAWSRRVATPSGSAGGTAMGPRGRRARSCLGAGGGGGAAERSMTIRSAPSLAEVSVVIGRLRSAAGSDQPANGRPRIRASTMARSDGSLRGTRRRNG